MDRRNFLGTAPLSAAALTLHNLNAVSSQRSSAGTAPEDSVLPPGVNYFTREKMEQLVNTRISLTGIPFEAVAFNLPNYHPSANQEKYSGKGWTEWELLKRAKPMFEGHLQPKYPLWGDYNEADPAWAAGNRSRLKPRHQHLRGGLVLVQRDAGIARTTGRGVSEGQEPQQDALCHHVGEH